MRSKSLRRLVFASATAALLCAGTIPYASAGIIGTPEVIADEAGAMHVERIRSLLDREDVRRQFERLGVASDAITARLDQLTPAELAALDDRLHQQIAGGDALGVIGAVFLVLLILEVVGVTDIFKAV